MELDLAEDPRIADEDEEEAESAEVYVEHLELREVEERLSRRPALPPLPPLPRRRTSGPAAAEVERQLNQILKGICVKGHFSVQSSNERSDTVARASLVVEEGPSELLNRVVRVYSLKDRNRAKQGDHVWVELRSCVLDRAALERGGPKTRWTMSEALSYVCIFGAVLRASTPAGVAAQRSCYLCKQSQMQWKPGVLNFIPFSHEVPILQVMVEGEDREQPLDEVFQLMMVDWPVNRLRPLAVIVEKLPVPRPLSLERSLEIFLKDLDFLQDPEDPKVQEMADEAVDLMTPEEELELVDASRRELDGQIFSIDAAGASIIDDALEYDLEEQVVRVHIADVAALVCSGGDLDLYAARRGCSVFIRDHHEELQRCEPMLPACVTFQTSLEKNQWRRALTFEFRVGEQLQFRGFFRSWVRSKEQLSFQDAEGLMGGMEAQGTTPGTSGVRRSLRALWQWTRAELEKRKAQGRAALQAFLSTASSRNSQEGHAESLVEFWMRQVNEESGGILAQHSAISYCFPCPDAHHFSRLAILCREALLRAGHAAQDELLLKLRSSPEECQESLADILSHVTRLTGRTAQRPNRWRSTARAATGEVTQGVSVLCQQLSQCVPIAQYRMKPSGETHWPILQQSQHYFQVTSPMRRWIDLLGQHLLLGTCQLDFEEMAQYVESFNEMSLLAKQTSSRFAFLSFCRELQQSERQMECVVTRIDQGTLHLACPDMAGFHGQMVLPLQLLSSHDLQVRPIIEEKKAIVTRVDDAKQLELRPFHSKMQVQLSLDQSSPVSLYRLCASALFLDFRDGSRAFRHAVLARQHPEVFGPVPDLRKAREMHRAGGLWGSTWQQVRQAQMCAAALMPQMRAKAPYHMTASYEELENFCFVGNRSEGYEVYVTVPSSYRGLRGLNKLQVGHLALLWRSDRGKLWMCCGAVKDIDVTEQMKRKTELCTRFARNGTCEYEDCWYAHGSDELIPERAKVTLRLSDCSARLLPAWAASNSGALDVDFAAISSREQLALKSIREVERTSRQPQQLVNRLVFRGRGPGGWHAPAIADEAPIDTPAGLPPLNNYQQKALQLTLKEVLAYVQGPPGTGKSTTAAHLICQLLLRPPQRGAMVKPLLVCCPSNKACDRLLHLFLKAEMSRDIWVVRVYAKTIEQNYWRDPRSQCCRDYEIDPDLLQYALHQQVEDQDPSFKQQYLDIAQELEDYCTKPGELLKVQKTLTEAKQTKELKSKEILKQAQVIFTTCDCACNDRLFQRMTFPSVIIDEAAQALEPELARCCLLAEDHLALFGDHEQLGPVLTEQTLFPAFKNMWTQSLFERIVSKRPGRQSNSPTTGIPHVTLKRQYRMHPSISCFANEEFYQCQLVDDEEAYRDGFTLPSEFNSRMSVIDVTGAHGRKSVAPEGDAVQDFETSLCNPSEAAVVKAYVTWLVALGVRVGEIGVVTPYRAQAALIKEVLTEALSNVSELPSIGTVHLLQGEERQYVILSLVRSFAEADTEVFDPVPQDARRRKVYSLGFLNDRRLANVALTRAQLGLVVVANTQVLSSASHWKNLFEHARNNRCYWDQDAAMDFFQSGEAPATSDSYWAEVRSQSPLASGSESEGHAEASASASEASEASAFGSAPSSAASVAEAAPEAPPVSAPAPVPVARRRRAKRSKAKAKAKAASQARRDREADDAEILEEALAETSAPLSPTTERERRAPAVCCVAECRIRPHQRSPFASAHGLCSAHWIELLKETNVLEQMDVDGLSPHSLQWPVSSMERFILPTYWNPLPPIVGDLGLRSRSFFSVLLRYLETKTQTSPESPSLDVLFTLAFTESIRSAKQLQMSPEDFLHTAAIGLLLALQAIEDCAGEVPSQFQERWQQLSGRRQSQQSYQEDLLAIATFWKEEGNRHKQKRHLPGEFQLALDSYAVGSELLEEEEANRLQDLLLQATPPFGR